MTIERSVTTSRFGRLSILGRLAGGIAGGVVGEGARRLARGERPSIRDVLLTPANAGRLAQRLSEMRGAAMKVGQLLSMDSGDLLPPQLGEMLARLREDAHHMPLGQLAQVLDQAWGDGWEKQFERFFFDPIAAASIGQVHRAILKGGRQVAIKVQYPGIRRSIDSDVDNVASLLRMFQLLPDEININKLLEEAKQQLHVEADYLQEAESMTSFASLLRGDPRFAVPAVIPHLTTSEALAMEFLDGHPIERLANQSRERRNRVGSSLLELTCREVFEWGLVQTDPNFANYQYEPASGTIQLLDFGATREYPADRRHALRRLLEAGVSGAGSDVADAATALGYLDAEDTDAYRDSIVALLRAATEPVRHDGAYHFGDSDLSRRMSEIVVDMRRRDRFQRIPPADLLFLHRKLGGLYMLLSRLRADIAVTPLLASGSVWP